MNASRLLSLVCLLGLFFVSSGCDTGPKSDSEIIQADPTLSSLSKVGQMYHDYHDANGQGPANWDELKTMAGDDQAKLDAIQYARDKGYELKWGMKFSQVTDGMSNTVLGQSPQESSLLYFDMSVKK